MMCDVCWKDSEIPWRRLPLWTAIKVSLELYLVNAGGLPDDTLEYKNFVLFFIQGVAKLSLQRQLAPELLFVINCKSARGATKPGPNVMCPIEDVVSGTVKDLRDNIQGLWGRIQARERRLIDAVVSPLSIISDTALALSNSRPYLEKIRDILCAVGQFPSPQSLQSLGAKDIYSLIDFEEWVRKKLPIQPGSCLLWPQTKSITAVKTLGRLLGAYYIKADQVYGQDPELLSTMILTVMEIWCAVDRLVIQNNLLLSSYPPDIPQGLLTPLLLQKGDDMRRLHAVETYILIPVTAERRASKALFSQKFRRLPLLSNYMMPQAPFPQ